MDTNTDTELCEACKSIFTAKAKAAFSRGNMVMNFERHHDDWTSFQDAIQHGCALCKCILLNTRKKDELTGHEFTTRYHISWWSEPPALSFEEPGGGVEFTVQPFGQYAQLI